MRSVLTDILSYCRPHGTRTETQFIARYIATLPGADQDEFGNWHVQIGDSRRVLYSCHIDTVHRRGGKQQVQVSPLGIIRLHPSEIAKGRNCLGADDGAGVYLLREMILAGKPGYYIFHYGEEAGCIGSGALAAERPDLLDGVEIAIAFDRGGRDDIITHQCSQRTASDEFARSLAKQLNRGGRFKFAPSPHGVYTDTERYAGLIPECTNVSIGYSRAHSSDESLDSSHVAALRAGLLDLNPDRLEVHRDPAARPELAWPDDWTEIDSRISVSAGPAYLDPVYEAAQQDLTEWLRRMRAERKGVLQ